MSFFIVNFEIFGNIWYQTSQVARYQYKALKTLQMLISSIEDLYANLPKSINIFAGKVVYEVLLIFVKWLDLASRPGRYQIFLRYKKRWKNSFWVQTVDNELH